MKTSEFTDEVYHTVQDLKQEIQDKNLLFSDVIDGQGRQYGTDKRKSEIINTPTSLAGAVFNSARHCLDYDFIKRNPDYRKLVAYIDVGEHNWLNFNMDAQAKKDLFRRSVEAASKFLRAFNWEG